MGLCELCGSEYPDGGDSKAIHESGRRHQRSLERQAQANDLHKKSVFVALTHKGDAVEAALDYKAIAAAFSVFGPVSHVSCGFLQDHAFVEFEAEDAVARALAAKSVRINDRLIGVIYERRITFHNEDDGPFVEPEEVIKHVNDNCCRGFSAQIDRIATCIGTTEQEVIKHVNDNCCRGFSAQIDRIAACIGTTEQEMLRRNAFRKRFEELLRQYVQNLNIVQFGSAMTGLGTSDSDIDLCLLFKDDNVSLMSEFVRERDVLLSCPPEEFRESPLHRDELSPLSIRDQTEVLYRILKELRREKSGFFKSLYLVADARCPVIRFRSYDRHLVELSVNNRIGCQKSAYIGALVQADQSGLLRKLVLALRFWAISNGVFCSEKRKTWNLNSYTLMLMFFSYLQSEKMLPEFRHSDEEVLTKSVDGVRVDFLVPSFTLSNVDLRRLFKKFFVSCIELHLDKTLFSLRNGGLLPLEDFKDKLTLKPQSVLFVQDPIELSDNVAKNVSIKAVKAMRHAMMLSLAAMKQNADSFAVMLGVLKSDSGTASPKLNMPPTEASCYVSGFPESFTECEAESLLSIMLSEVLRCDSAGAPAKRPRFDCETAGLGAFIAKRRLWMSRRALRKKWSGVLGSEEQFPLLVEALVSTSLDANCPTDCCLQFSLFFDLDKDSLWVGLKLIDGEMVDVANVAHFMEQMLAKTREFLSCNARVEGYASIDVFTSQVKKIFEEHSSRVK
ncbi:unnamed protein product [Heligmosomoides polygyrus]|uniref:RRM domain-containing protein n=1 Tax=Heligmosomoides polygyrus TaxID=6339 RepID=A0A183GLN3_HELPZ|nr:unnamed protein product [Heligmosomoides polygyrus]